MSKFFSTTVAMAILSWQLWPQPLKASIDHEKAWVDLPKFSDVSLPFSKATWFDVIAQKVQEYHQIDKNSVDTLDTRISALDSLSSRLDTLISETDSLSDKKYLQRLNKMTRNKIWYLQEIQKLYTRYQDDPESLRNHFTEAGDSQQEALILVNDVFYDFQLPAAWGLYWLEVLDPSHRLTLTPYYMQWRKSETEMPFFMWLETENVPFHTTEVNYLNSDEINQFQLHYSDDDHLLYTTQGSIADFSDPDIEYLYVLNLDGSLLVAPGSETIRHASLSQGRPVIGSGSVKIIRGKVSFLDVESGHYQPKAVDLRSAIKALQDKGVLFTNDMQVKYYQPSGERVEISLDDFRKSSLQSAQLKPQPQTPYSSFKL